MEKNEKEKKWRRKNEVRKEQKIKQHENLKKNTGEESK